MSDEITQLLAQISVGDTQAFPELLRQVYAQLRRMARAKMRLERRNHTLDATALVHEAFLRIANGESFESRRHFFGAAAEAMRRILVDHARAKQAQKRGGKGAQEHDISPESIALRKWAISQHGDDRIEQLDRALERFEQQAPDKAALVKLRYFVGLTIKEAAEVLGISPATADRHWAYAKVWLQTEMESAEEK